MDERRNSTGAVEVSTSQGSIFTYLLLISLITPSSYCSPVECCKPEIGWKNGTHFCNDGSKINLNCSSDECFEVDPANDPFGRFYVDSFDRLIFIDNENKFTSNESSDTYCQAHLNDELRIMVCFTNILSSPPTSWEEVLYGICFIVSSLFAGLTLVVYLVLPELRELQDKAMISLCAAFTVAFLVLGTMKVNVLDAVLDDSACVFIACLMYYFLLCTFFWMNVTSLNIWKSVWFSDSKVNDSKFFIAYCLYGWGIPSAFLAFAVITHFFNIFKIKPGFSEHSCWFHSDYSTWLYFYGPMLVLLLINFIYLGLSVWKLWHIYAKLNYSNVKVLRVKYIMCLKLSIVMGVTWIFEMIHFYFKDTDSNMEYLFIFMDFLNSLQGLFIFIVLVVLRDKVKILLAEHRVCNIPFPKSWANYKDLEKWDENEIDIFQMTLK